jgi:RecA-family ATPase
VDKSFFEHPDAAQHDRERLEAMQAALARAERTPQPVLMPEMASAREDPDFIDGEVEIGMQGSLLEMLIAQGEPDPDDSWAVKDVWKPGSLTLAVGTQQSFKSWAMLDLLYHAADGTDWLDKAISQPYDVCVYVSGEKGSHALYERLWLLFNERHDLANRVIIKHRADGLKFGTQQWHALVEEVHALAGERVLVILDTLTSLAPGGYDENSLQHVSVMLESVRALQRGEKVDVVLVHHLNAMGTRARGHTALDGEVDGFVHFDRRGRDVDEVFVRFEPKDGLPTMGSFRFDPKKGMFHRAAARALHVANLRTVVAWWQERNNGEGITMRELRDSFYTAYRYHQVEEMVTRAIDELVLKKEERTSMLTNRMANMVTVLEDDERDHIIAQRREVEHEEVMAQARGSALMREAERMAKTTSGALGKAGL